MGKKIAIGIVVVVAAFLVVVALQPAEVTVKRSATIAAPPATVHRDRLRLRTPRVRASPLGARRDERGLGLDLADRGVRVRPPHDHHRA